MATNFSGKMRVESDLIGEMQVPVEALYGVQTLRGVENFPISRFHLSDYPLFINGLAMTKLAAAKANHQLGLLTDAQFDGISKACLEIMAGQHHDQFPCDMIQGGAGTTTNMNANEVIANRALQIMGHEAGEYQYCSPNDHVNCSQSTNDAYPCGIHLGLYRTQLEDAVPMTLGQTFGAFAQILREEKKNLEFAAEEFLTVNMGATAIGTGICSEPEYSEKCIAALRQITGWDIKLAEDLVAATSDTSCMVGYSSALRRVAVKLNKICNDLRLLASGPRCGLHEFDLPARQPGSSIMPGKVNPVIPEVMNQICYKVIGNDACVAMCGQEAQMELNAMEPTMAQCCFESAEIMMNGFDTLRVNCVDGITANEEQCRKYVQDSFGIVTALNPVIGYKNSTKIAKKAMATGGRVYDIVLEDGILTKEELDTILLPENMIKPVKLNIKPRR